MPRPSLLLCVHALGAAACAPPLAPPHRGPDLAALFAAPPPADAPVLLPPAKPDPSPSPASPCATDDDCGYDPVHRQCGTDPRFNRQPPLVDQGLVCYCEAARGACALLRVEPSPCEGEASCAVRLDPRPHPVHIDAEHPYQAPRPCRRPRRGERGVTDLYATCEQTNLCTMNRRACTP